jgi:diguanylate cyclase (GGDEF)-like protein/PAS domain S-box-containing protein
MIDIKTLMIIYLSVNIINTGAMIVIWRQNQKRYKGISFWLVGLTLQAVGSLLLILRGHIPNIISMTGSNVIILGGLLIVLMGLERFTGRNNRNTHNYLLLVVFIAVSIYFVLIQPNQKARDIAFTAMLIIYTFQCSWLLLRSVDRGMRRLTQLTGIMFGVYTTVNLSRIILTVFFDQGNDFFKAGVVTALSLTLYILLNISLTICFVLMVNGRLLKNVQSEEEKSRLLIENSQDIIYTITTNGVLTFVSHAWTKMLGHLVQQVIGQPIGQFVHTEDLPLCMEWIKKVIETGQSKGVVEYRVRHMDGSWYWHESRAVPLKDKTGAIIGFEGIARDITKRKELQQKLEEMATHDYLTGLPNRALLNDRFTIAAVLAQRNKNRLAIMSLDLDKFKSINDTLGHGAGDQMLKAVSKRLNGIIRASDTLARVGGDEFVLMMLETNNMENATTIAQKILDSFKESMLIDGHELHLSTSIGIAMYPEDAEDLENLTKKSDAAMYYSKGHGRNQFKFFGDGNVQTGGDNKSVN